MRWMVSFCRKNLGAKQARIWSQISQTVKIAGLSQCKSGCVLRTNEFLGMWMDVYDGPMYLVSSKMLFVVHTAFRMGLTSLKQVRKLLQLQCT